MIELLSHQEYRSIAAELRLPNQPYLNGKYVRVEGSSFATYNPATGEEITQITDCGPDIVDEAVSFARHAFRKGDWSKSAPEHRKAVLIRFAKLIKRHAQELATLESLDAGKPINDCIKVDLPEVINTIIWYAEAIDKVFDQLAPAGDNVLSMIVREPAGVTAAILPWNFPLLMAAWKIGPALASGNSLILKPAEETSMSVLRLAELANEAGIPDGVLQVVTGRGELTGKAIGLHHDIDVVSFTGSTEVGRLFLQYSAQSNLKKIVLECGGKNPFVVLDDAKRLDDIAEAAVNATFWNMGENCSSGSRMIIHQSLLEPLTEKIAQRCKQLSVGEPLDPKMNLGALISKNHFDKVHQAIEKGIEDGYRIIAGGLPQAGQQGYFIPPTIFSGVDNQSSLGQMEIFGPVMSIIAAQSNEHAIELANDTEYGLSASLFCRDIYSVHHYAREIKAGTITVNCYGEGNITTPFGGYKLSGFGGRDNGLQAFDQYTEIKTIWIDLHA